MSQRLNLTTASEDATAPVANPAQDCPERVGAEQTTAVGDF